MIYVSGSHLDSFTLVDVCRRTSLCFLGQLHPASQKQYCKLGKVYWSKEKLFIPLFYAAEGFKVTQQLVRKLNSATYERVLFLDR